MSSVSGLATNAALTAVDNKMPNISSLVKKADYDTKITEIEKKLTDHNQNKYITTPEFNSLAAGAFDARLKQADLNKQILIVNREVLIKKLTQMKQSTYLLKMN